MSASAEPWADGLPPPVAAYVRAHLDAVKASSDLRLSPADQELQQRAYEVRTVALALWAGLTEEEREQTNPALALAMVAQAGRRP